MKYVAAVLLVLLALLAYAQQLNRPGVPSTGGTGVFTNLSGGPGNINIIGNTPQSQITNVNVKGVINVKIYGAKGDGVTDDTAALQAAANASNSSTCIFFPPGNYVATQDLNLTRNSQPFCIQGTDPRTTRITCEFATPNQGNCVDASGADAFSISNISILAGTSPANAPKVALLLARTANNQGYGHTLTNVSVGGHGPYSIYDYGAEVGNWVGVRSQPGAVVISECNNAGIISKYQTLVAPPTSMSTINMFGGQFWAAGSQGNRCGIIFDASCPLIQPPPSNAPFHMYAAIHDINIYSAFFGEEGNGASTTAPTAGLCDTSGSDNSTITEIGIYGVRMEVADKGANYTFADFSGSYAAAVNFYQDTLATSALTGTPVVKVGGCIDSSYVDVSKAGAGLAPGVFAIQAACGRNDDFMNTTHDMVPRVLFAGLSNEGDTANRFAWFDGNYGHYDAGGFESNAIATSLNGTTAGSVTWAQPSHSLSYHMVSFNFLGYQNKTTTGQIVTYPIQFGQPPAAIGTCPPGMNLTDGRRAVLPFSMSDPFTGQCTLAGQ
jgi:hypothetical protein